MKKMYQLSPKAEMDRVEIVDIDIENRFGADDTDKARQLDLGESIDATADDGKEYTITVCK
jgi:hypothetical protein